MVEDTIAKANRSVTLYSRMAKPIWTCPATKVHYGTAGAAVSMVDVHGNEYRDSTVQDLHDASRICEQLENIHFVQRPMVCRDIPDNLEMDLNTIYACCSGTFKHIGTSFTEPSHVAPAIEMIYMIAGGEDKFRERPVHFQLELLCRAADEIRHRKLRGDGTLHQGRDAGSVAVGGDGRRNRTLDNRRCDHPGHRRMSGRSGLCKRRKSRCPAIFGTWPFGLDLRTGAMSIGSGEQALLTAGCAQMHHFYDLPGGAAAGASDSKMPDMQAGWEQMCSNVMAGLSGVNMVYEAAGMHASLLGFCFESLILSDDLIGQAQRCVRGIEVTDETLALDQMAEVCMGGPGHYLGTDATLRPDAGGLRLSNLW